MNMKLQEESSKFYFDENKMCEKKKRKLDVIEIAMKKLTRHFFELELLEIMGREIEIKLRLKEKEVGEEIRKLEEMEYQRWSKINDFCDRIWKISAKNDLFNLFNKYLDMPKCISYKIDPEQHPEVLKLKLEVDELKMQLTSKKFHSSSLEEKMLQTKIQLQIAQSYHKDPEIIRLTKNVKIFQSEISTLENKIQALEAQNSNKLPKPASKLISVRNNKNNFVTATELIAQEENKDFFKRSTFSVKKESAISRKLADIRGTG